MEKEILVYGLGKTGSAACEVLKKHGFSVSVTADDALEEQRADFLDQLPGVAWKHPEDVGRAYLPARVVKSPGIRPDTALMQRLEEKHIAVISDLEMAQELFPDIPMAVITGSNGKTTTSALLAHLLKQCGKRAEAVGNIGVPILSYCDQHKDLDLLVVEASSFQLHSTVQFHGRWNAILNLSPDHVDWHGSYEAYCAAKLKLLTQLQMGDRFYYLPQESAIAEKVAAERRVGVTYVPVDIAQWDELLQEPWFHLVGAHNRSNAAFALTMAADMGITRTDLKKALESFRPIAHRLETIGFVQGVRYVNDSKGTNVDASVIALRSFDAPIHLLAGGYDKQVDFSALVDAFCAHGKALYVYGATAKQIERAAKQKEIAVQRFETLKDALQAAACAAKPGEVVLLSPACASWDQFSSFEQRGEMFRQYVKAMPSFTSTLV